MKAPSFPRPSGVRRLLMVALAAAGTVAALPAHADRGVHFRGGVPTWGRSHGPTPIPGPIRAPFPGNWGHSHYDGYRGGHWNGWWVVGTPWLFYPPPYYSYPPAVVREEPIPLPNLPATPQNWYYCDSAQSYYPYAQTCPEGWRTIPAAPAGNTQTAPPEAQNWYYCDSARGYYPYVQRCPEKWRPVPATPPAGAPEPEGVNEE